MVRERNIIEQNTVEVIIDFPHVDIKTYFKQDDLDIFLNENIGQITFFEAIELLIFVVIDNIFGYKIKSNQIKSLCLVLYFQLLLCL